MPRSLKLTPEKRVEMRRLEREGLKAPEIAVRLELGLSTVYNELARLRRAETLEVPMGERRVALEMTHSEFAALSGSPVEPMLVASQLQQDSLKRRLLRAIVELGPYPDIKSLMQDVRSGPGDQSFGAHEVAHLIWSLQKQGFVRFNESKKKASLGSTALSAIRATPMGEQEVGLGSKDLLDSQVLAKVCEDGYASSSVALSADLWKDNRGPDHDQVFAALERLNRKGFVIYKLPAARGTVVEIRPTNAGYDVAGVPVPGRTPQGRYGNRTVGTSRPGHAVGKDMTEKRHHLPWATGSAVIKEPLDPTHRANFPDHQHGDEPSGPPSAPSVLPEPAPPPAPPKVTKPGNYPLLEALKASFAERAAADAKASALADAAALLEKIDPEESERLMSRALAMSPPALTPLEQEFLKYAEEHPE